MDIYTHAKLPWRVVTGEQGEPEIKSVPEDNHVVSNSNFPSSFERDCANAYLSVIGANFHARLVHTLKAVVNPDLDDMAGVDAIAEAARGLLDEIEIEKRCLDAEMQQRIECMTGANDD
jgi:hypothetical protein